MEKKDLNHNLNRKAEIENWRNEHGEPSFEYLQSLIDDGSIEANDKVRSIAEDLDIVFTQDTPIDELVGMIRSFVRINADSGA